MGKSPTAVSPDNMTADVPSRIALATSLASARVGSGWWIIDSSICVADVRRRAHERQRHVVDADLQRKLEVVDVLAGQRGDRNRNSRQVHALVRADDAADHDTAPRSPVLDLLHTQTNVSVVDQDVVPG